MVEAILALSGIIFMVLRARAWVLFLTWTALYFIAYSLLGVSRYFWYYAPLVPGFIVLIGLGLTTILYVGDQSLKQPDFKKTMGQRFQLFLVIGVFFLSFLVRELAYGNYINKLILVSQFIVPSENGLMQILQRTHKLLH